VVKKLKCVHLHLPESYIHVIEGAAKTEGIPRANLLRRLDGRFVNQELRTRSLKMHAKG
jgi:hypothetical protein